MSLFALLSLFGIMLVLAAMPSTSVALVVTRAATSGLTNGIAVAAGIVLGDLVFVLLAILGLSFVAETMASLFMVIKYLGAAYLIWLGITLLASKSTATVSTNQTRGKSGLIASFLAGFFLTLGDIKAVFFYISLFPIYIDLSVLQVIDIILTVFITVFSVGGVKVFYAFSATKIASLARYSSFEYAARKAAGTFMIGAAGYLIIKNW